MLKKISPGIRFMLLATLAFAIMNVCVKMLVRISAVEIVGFRALITLLITFYLLKKRKINPWGNDKKWLILRSVFGTIALTLYFLTLKNMPLATAVVFQYLSPIFTAFFAIFILGEKVKKLQWLFFLISFIGVIIIKGFGAVDLLYFIVALTSALFTGLAYNSIRKLKDTDHPLVVVFFFPLIALPVTIALMIFNSEWWILPLGQEWFWLMMVGVSTQVGQVFITKAYQAESAARVSAVTYFGMIYAVLFGAMFFTEWLSISEVIGISVVLIGVLLNVSISNKKVKSELKS